MSRRPIPLKDEPSAQEVLNEDRIYHRGMLHGRRDDVKEVIMVKIFGSAPLLESIGLHFPPSASELWGLLVLGKKLHFYAPAWESPMMSLFRIRAGEKAPGEQYACFSDLPAFCAFVPITKGFFRFFMPKNDVCISFEEGLKDKNEKFETADKEKILYFTINEKPSKIVEKLEKYFK